MYFFKILWTNVKFTHFSVNRRNPPVLPPYPIKPKPTKPISKSVGNEPWNCNRGPARFQVFGPISDRNRPMSSCALGTRWVCLECSNYLI